MTGRNSSSGNDRDWLAADFALGIAEESDRAEAQRLYDTDAQFRAEVDLWTGWLGTMLLQVEPVEPPADVLPRIEARLAGNDNRPSDNSHIARWRAATFAMTAVAASLAAVLAFQPRQLSIAPVAPTPETVPAPVVHAQMVATISGDSGKAVAHWDGGRTLMVVPVDMPAAPKAKSYELWMLPKAGKPHPMGLMPEGPMMVDVASDTAALLAEGASFAVSIEPERGSPTGLPTGPVIASGKLLSA